MHRKSKRQRTNPMHPSSSSNFQRHQEHNLKHPGSVDFKTNYLPLPFTDRSFHWVVGRAFRFSQCPFPLLFCLSFSTEYLAGLYIWWSPRWTASPKSGLHSAIASCALILAMNLSISTSAQYVTLYNKIKCLSLAVFLGNPTNKTVTWTAYMWPPLIVNNLDQSLWSTNQKYWVAVRSNSLHSFWEVNNCVAPFTTHSKLHQLGAEKPISWDKPAHFDFFAINFTVWSHVLSTFGDVLRDLPYTKCLLSFFFSLGINCVLQEKKFKLKPSACIYDRKALGHRPSLR